MVIIYSQEIDKVFVLIWENYEAVFWVQSDNLNVRLAFTGRLPWTREDIQ